MKAGLPRTPTAVGSVPVEIGVPVWDHLPVWLWQNTPATVSMSSLQNGREFKVELVKSLEMCPKPKKSSTLVYLAVVSAC